MLLEQKNIIILTNKKIWIRAYNRNACVQLGWKFGENCARDARPSCQIGPFSQNFSFMKQEQNRGIFSPNIFYLYHTNSNDISDSLSEFVVLLFFLYPTPFELKECNWYFWALFPRFFCMKQEWNKELFYSQFAILIWLFFLREAARKVVRIFYF